MIKRCNGENKHTLEAKIGLYYTKLSDLVTLNGMTCLKLYSEFRETLYPDHYFIYYLTSVGYPP